MPNVNIKGVIVGDDEKWIYDWFGIAAVSPKDVTGVLTEADGEDVDVIINSGGGSVFAGSEIYTALKSYKGGTIGKVVGLAASAASVAAMGCDILAVSPTSQMMVHNAWTRVSGDYRDMEHGAEFLKNTNASIANAYRLKTGKSEDELKAMMDKETWLTAQQAVKEGFADEILFDEQKQLAASADRAGLLPPEVINRVRMLLAKEQDSKAKEQDKHKPLLAAKLKLIKLKGGMLDE